MDWEAPVDGWYVWLAVALVSMAFVGIALSLPSGPPPDANRAANTIDDVAGTNYESSARMDHDAETVKIEGRAIEMRNDDGTSHASLAFGQVVVVNGHDKLEDIAYGSSFAEEYEMYPANPTSSNENIQSDIEEAWSNRSEWKEANGKLVVRSVSWESGYVADPNNPDLWEEAPTWVEVEGERYYVTLVVV